MDILPIFGSRTSCPCDVRRIREQACRHCLHSRSEGVLISKKQGNAIQTKSKRVSSNIEDFVTRPFVCLSNELMMVVSRRHRNLFG